MKKSIFIILLIFLVGFRCPAYAESKESNALASVQALFGGEKEWSINPLKGGLSGASIFLAEDAIHNKYVVRFFDHLPRSEFDRLILNHQAAHRAGYGPKIYSVDPKKSMVVMEFIHSEPPENVLQNLSILLKKIHASPVVGHTGRLWDRSYFFIEEHKKKNQNLVDFDKVKLDLDEYVLQAGENLDAKTCHRDLNPTNILFSKDQFYAIDYDYMGIDDPYVDLAQIAIFYCSTPQVEEKFLSLYLGRDPDDVELQKLKVFKKIVLIFYGTAFLKVAQEDCWENRPEIIPCGDYLLSIREGRVSLENPQEQLRFGLILLREAEAI